MTLLKEILSLKEDSPIEIVLGTDGPHIYEHIKKVLQEKAEPVLNAYLASLKIREELQKVTSIEMLERVEIVYMTLEFKELVAELIDGFVELTTEQRVWLFTVFLNSFYHGAAAHITPYFNGRYEQLQNKGKIVKSSFLNTLTPEDFNNNAIMNHQRKR